MEGGWGQTVLSLFSQVDDVELDLVGDGDGDGSAFAVSGESCRQGVEGKGDPETGVWGVARGVRHCRG